MHISQRLSIMARTGADVKGENVSFFLSLISTRICYDGVPINMKGRVIPFHEASEILGTLFSDRRDRHRGVDLLVLRAKG